MTTSCLTLRVSAHSVHVVIPDPDLLLDPLSSFWMRIRKGSGMQFQV
jgi:hypothetical protein